MRNHQRNILVTGGAGFIGSHYVKHWLNQYTDDHIVVLDALTYAGNMSNLEVNESQSKLTFIEGDIGDQALLEEIFFDFTINTLVNFASESHVDRSITNPDKFIETNIVGTYTLLKTAMKFWSTENSIAEHHFHHISTDEVFGDLRQDNRGFVENSPYAPNSPYSASKASSDFLVRAYNKTYKLNTTISHCSNNFGSHQAIEKLIPKTITNILQDKTIPIYGSGKQVRDWICVEDHVSGIEQILEKGVFGETYNLGGNNELSNIELVRLICQILESEFEVNSHLIDKYPRAESCLGQSTAKLILFSEDRPGHDFRYAVDSSKAKTQLGFKPSDHFEEALTATVRWYLDNPEWWLV